MEAPAEDDGGLRKKIIAIQLDKTLTDAQKAQKRQELMAGKWMVAQKAAESEEEEEDDGAPSPHLMRHFLQQFMLRWCRPQRRRSVFKISNTCGNNWAFTSQASSTRARRPPQTARRQLSSMRR